MLTAALGARAAGVTLFMSAVKRLSGACVSFNNSPGFQCKRSWQWCVNMWNIQSETFTLVSHIEPIATHTVYYIYLNIQSMGQLVK